MHNKHLLAIKGPAIITANHPNSFLDAIIICSVFKQPVYSLARGDAFKQKWTRAILTSLYMLPIYRLSEGKENLHLNKATFLQCQQILAKKKIVLIFIEGICKQAYQLQSFKKGAARIVYEAIQKNKIENVRVLGLAIQYNSFTHFGKKVHVGLQSVSLQNINTENGFATFANEFNNTVKEYLLKQLICTHNTAAAQQLLTTANSYVGYVSENQLPATNTTSYNKKLTLLYFLYVPIVVINYFINGILYYLLKYITQKITAKTVFYDSVLFGLLFLFYPIYLFLLALLVSTIFNYHIIYIIGSIAITSIVVALITAKSR